MGRSLPGTGNAEPGRGVDNGRLPGSGLPGEKAGVIPPPPGIGITIQAP